MRSYPVGGPMFYLRIHLPGWTLVDRYSAPLALLVPLTKFGPP